VRAPLECRATLPLQSTAFLNDSAALAIALSGTQNHTTSAQIRAGATATAAAPTSAANRRARPKEAARSRETISSIGYPALSKATVNAPARLPAPMIATRGFVARFADVPCGMPGSIAESPHRPARQFHARAPHRNAVLYIVLMPKSAHSKPKTSKAKRASSKAKVISSRTVYRGPVFWVTTDEVQEPGGVRARRDIIHHTGSVVILAVDDSGATPRVILERQYRHAANAYLWEIPAGRIDAGEVPLAAAKRELLEETGYTAAHWRNIFTFYASPGCVAETMAVYLATGLRAGKAHPEADEIIQQRMVPLSTAVRMVLRNTIRDAKTICSILWLDHQVANNQLRQHLSRTVQKRPSR
jgi:ADP-ribose pyrophosphatase